MGVSIPAEMQWVHLYMLAADEEAKAKKQQTKYRDLLKPYLMDNVDEDERGNFSWVFDSPIASSTGTVYTGVMAQRRVSEYVNEDRAKELIDLYNLGDRCIKQVITYEIDYDELYAANQEGIIPDDAIDSIIETDVSYALVRVKQ